MDFSDVKQRIHKSKKLRTLKRVSFWLSFFTLGLIVFDVGFMHAPETEEFLRNFYFLVLLTGTISIIIRYIATKEKFKPQVRIFDGFIFLLFILLVLIQIDTVRESLHFLAFLNKIGWVYLALFIYFIREFSALKIDLKREYINPAQLFIASFIFIILTGTFLLLLPNATHDGISVVDAFFTATSAVCVTGLIVVDTGSYFTQFGQIVIVILIQLGGLGIMTFASYFSYFFRGKTSYENQLILKDIANSDKIGEVYSVLKKIILLTFIVELIGAVIIYFSLDKSNFSAFSERFFFSVFHSVSAFCNAGFSTLENSLYEPGFRFNYPLHLIIAVLFIIGGLGFPILLNLYKYLTYATRNRLLKIRHPQNYLHVPWVISLNTRLVTITTTVLLAAGTILFFFFEYNNTLAEHSGFGKVVTAFFGAATPRTAGFNSVDTSALNFSTIMIIFLLMWIGASPASTGGGIKTSTFAIATLNFFSLARGKDRVEFYKREIADLSVRRSFAIIALSLMVIGTAVFLIASFDSEKDLLDIAFECFSAYSTVGLSLGITADLSPAAKLVITATMFIGRVSMLTILIALLRRVKHLNYKYPTEEILIN